MSHPTVLLLESLDAMCLKKKKSSSQTHAALLTARLVALFDEWRLRQQESKLFIVATATVLDDVDMSLRRPGRLDREVIALNCFKNKTNHILTI